MASQSIVYVVFALTLIAMSSAQTANRNLYFDNIGPNSYNSLPLFPGGTLNIEGPVTLLVFSTFPVEVCVTQGIALSGSYSACAPGMGLNYAGSGATEESYSDSIYGDSMGMKEEVGMSDFLAAPPKPPVKYGNFSVYLINGTFYYVNLHPTTSNFQGANATSANIIAQYNPNNCNNKGKCPLCIGTPTSCVSFTAVKNNTQQNFTLGTGDAATYFIGMNVPLAATSYVVNLVSRPTSHRTDDPFAANASFPFVCVRHGSAPVIGCQNPPIYDQIFTPANWTQDPDNEFTYLGFMNLTNPTPGNYFFEFYNPLQSTGFLMSYTSSVQYCSNGNLGSNCTQKPTVLATANVTGPVSTGASYDYYMINNNTLNVGVATKNLKINAPALLTHTLNWPSNQSFLLNAQNKTVNYLSAFAPNPIGQTTWYIAVATVPLTPYYIWANEPCAYNCIAPGKNGAAGSTAHGNCTTSNGTCACNKHYGGLWCYHTGLATVWIVLIVIGCAILLAIAIGVPVALYLRSRQRARYERV
jgi:hypothetical protein